MATGRVIGGHYLNAPVSTAPIGGALVIQTGLRWRKLNEEQVLSWSVESPEQKSGTLSAVGQAVAGAVAPRFLGKAASAAVGAALDAKIKPPRLVRVRWNDGKQSLIKFPESLYQHFAMMLPQRATPASSPDTTAVDGGSDQSSMGQPG
ncbi:hypothetical protein [Glutamicibacter arilaitensis]|uniref:hypothetical protein n=1 Tax=Glutamicibacter arilaitensis TaxID=256701 RepID=UPI003F903F31